MYVNSGELTQKRDRSIKACAAGASLNLLLSVERNRVRSQLGDQCGVVDMV
jgi:hypothetical protein